MCSVSSCPPVSMDNRETILAVILRALEAAGIPYMVTGSLASSFHGVPRGTQDIDIVIAPTNGQPTADPIGKSRMWPAY
jgi:hypothetical protein